MVVAKPLIAPLKWKYAISGFHFFPPRSNLSLNFLSYLTISSFATDICQIYWSNWLSSLSKTWHCKSLFVYWFFSVVQLSAETGTSVLPVFKTESVKLHLCSTKSPLQLISRYHLSPLKVLVEEQGSLLKFVNPFRSSVLYKKIIGG